MSRSRQEVKTWLIDNFGIEQPTNAQVSVFLDYIDTLSKDAVNNAIEQTKASYKDYKTPEDYNKLSSEIAELKDKDAKSSRVAKYKEKGLADKWFDYADSKLKDSKNMDEDLDKFVKENTELLVKKEENKEVKKEESNKGSMSFGAGGNGAGGKSKTSAFDEAFYKLNPSLKPKN